MLEIWAREGSEYEIPWDYRPEPRGNWFAGVRWKEHHWTFHAFTESGATKAEALEELSKILQDLADRARERVRKAQREENRKA